MIILGILGASLFVWMLCVGICGCLCEVSEENGMSMYPTLKPTDVFIIWPFLPCRLEEGKVYIYTVNNELVVKRLIAYHSGLCWFEGDNSKNSRDSRSYGWVPRDQVVGVTTHMLAKRWNRKWIYKIPKL